MKRNLSIGMALVITTCIMLTACTPSKGTGTSSNQDSKATASVSSSSVSSPSPSPEGFVSDPNLNKPGETPVCKQTVALKIGMDQDACVKDYVDNTYTKRLEELGNIKLSFELYPSKNSTEKLSLMIAAGGTELPDIIIKNLPDASVYSYGQQKMFIPLNDYFKYSSYNIKACLERVKDKHLEKYFTSADGNIYTVPAYMESLYNEYPARYYINEPWLNKLNVKSPTTLDEYVEVLRKFKTQDLNENGKNDEIPLVSDSTDTFAKLFPDLLMSSFINSNPNKNYMILKDGKLSVAYNTEQWKKGLKYVAKMVSEGLLDPVSFTQDAAQMKALADSKDIIVGSTIGAGGGRTTNMDRYYDYILCGPLPGPDGYKSVIFQPTLPYNMFYITKNCKNPETAFRLADLMWSSEMTMWSRWGQEGVDWVKVDPGTRSAFDYLGYKAIFKTILNWGSVQNAHWQNQAPVFRTYEVAAGMASSNVTDKAITDAQRFKAYIDSAPAPSEAIYKIIYTKEELEEVTDIETNLKKYVEESRAQFMCGAKDIDKEWSSYVKELENIGLSKYLKIAQTALDRMNR